MRIRSKAFYARSCEEYYLKAEKEAQKEESKISYQGGSKKNNHHHQKNKSVGKPISQSKSQTDLYEENKKQRGFSPKLKDQMTNFVMEAGAFDNFFLNDTEHLDKKNKSQELNVDSEKVNERVKTNKHKKIVKEKDCQLSDQSQKEQEQQQDNNEVDILEVRKRSFSINNGTLLPNHFNAESLLPSNDSSSEDKSKQNSEQNNQNNDSQSDDDKSGSGSSSDSDQDSSHSDDSSDNSSDDNDDDDEESIRLKESQQIEKNENGVYENEYFNSANNWGRRKKLNLSQTSEFFDENLCNFENFNGSSSVNLKQIKTNVMIIGEYKIGKTELLSEMFTNNQFPSKLNANYSLDLMIHKLSKSEQEYKICLWIQNLSTMQYQWIIEQVYYKIVSTFIFLYNDSDPKSLDAVKTTYQKTKAQAPNAKYILIGITTQNGTEQKELQEKAKAFSEENNFNYYFERMQSQPTEETHLNSLKHYICPLLFDKENNDSFKCSDFQICQNSTQDSPKSIEFSLNKNISQEFCFAKNIQNQQSPTRNRNIDLMMQGDLDQVKYQQNTNFKDGNGFCLSETRRQQKNFQEDDINLINQQNSRNERYIFDQDESMQYTQSNKTFQTFPLLNEQTQIISDSFSWPVQQISPIHFDQNKSCTDKNSCINLIPSEIQNIENSQQLQVQQSEQRQNEIQPANLEIPEQSLQIAEHTLSEIPIKISQQG